MFKRTSLAAIGVLSTVLSVSPSFFAFGQPAALDGSAIIVTAQIFPGLDPSGTTDSTAALQQALNAAAGKTMILTKGVYRVTSLTLPKEGIRIAATGAKFELGDNATDGQPMMRLAAHSQGIEIDGLEIDGRAPIIPHLKDLREAMQTPNAKIIHPARISGIVSEGHVSDVHLKNMTFRNLPQNAVELSNGDSHWEFSNNRIEGTGRHGFVVGFVTEQVHDLSVHDNHIVNCALSPISIIANSNEINSAGAAHVDIQRNYVSRNGLDLNGYSPNNRNITISNNVIEDNGVLNVMGHAIHFAGTNIIITKNIARNTAISAIVISGAPNSNPTPGEKFEVSDNVIETVLSTKNSKGILIQNTSSGRISGNKISGTKECPIEVDGNALGHGGPRIHDIAITDNIITKSPLMGDQGVCASNAENLTIKNNRFTP